MRLHIILAPLLALASPAVAQDASPARTEAIDAIREARKIVSENGVERLEKVKLGGVEQWVSIRGRDRDNPILLFLHGGPGLAIMPMAWTFQNGWEDYFTVVQWDQRGAGKTHALHDAEATARTMTKDRIVTDAEELIGWLRNEFGKEKVFLAGLSWGSVVGLEVASRHPEWLHAYVGMGQVIDFRENEKRGWDFAMTRARAEGNGEAVAELEAIQPYPPQGDAPDPQSLYTQRKWVEYYGGAMHNRKGYGSAIATVNLSPDYDENDIAAFFDAAGTTFPILYPDLLAFDASDMRRLECPVVLFLGRHDYNIVSSVAAEWHAKLEAPAKDVVWFEHSAHVVMMEEPGKTLVELVNRVRPFADPERLPATNTQ